MKQYNAPAMTVLVCAEEDLIRTSESLSYDKEGSLIDEIVFPL